MRSSRRQSKRLRTRQVALSASCQALALCIHGRGAGLYLSWSAQSSEATSACSAFSQHLTQTMMLQAAELADTDAPKPVKQEAVKQEEPANPEHWHTEAATSTARCRVIQEGDPQPGLAGGRMQFSGTSTSAVDPQVCSCATLLLY